MALLFDQVSAAQLVDRPHGLAAEDAWNFASTLPCAILMLSVMLVFVSFVRRRLEIAIMKQAAAVKHQHLGTACLPSAFRLLCQSFDAVQAGVQSCEITQQAEEVLRASELAPPAPCCEVVPQAEAVQAGETAKEVLRAGETAPLAPCCGGAPWAEEIVRASAAAEEVAWAGKTAPPAPCCEVSPQAEDFMRASDVAEEVVRAGTTAPPAPCCVVALQSKEVVRTGSTVEEGVWAGDTVQEVARLSKPVEQVVWASKPVPGSEKLRSATDDSGVSKGSDCEALVALVAPGTATASLAADGSIVNIATDAGETSPPPLGDVVEGTTVAEANSVAVGGGPQTIYALKSTLQENDHSTSGLVEVSSSALGCSMQRVYSNALFWAHRNVYLKISKGAPGLQRIHDPSPASVKQAPWPEMPKSLLAHELGAALKGRPLHHRCALRRHDLKCRSYQSGQQ